MANLVIWKISDFDNKKNNSANGLGRLRRGRCMLGMTATEVACTERYRD